MNILAIIPARGGSTRIPGKNLKTLAGRPLLDWTLRAAVDSGRQLAIVLSTDSSEIEHSDPTVYADSVLRRKVSGDGPLEPVIEEAIQRHHDYDAYMLLQPTSPLRTSEDIDAVIKLLEEGARSVVSVTRDPGAYFGGTLVADYDGVSEPYWQPTFPNRPRSQDLDYYRENGAIWAFTRREWESTHNRRGRRPVPYVMPPERSIDLDTLDDWERAETLLAVREGKKVSESCGITLEGCPISSSQSQSSPNVSEVVGSVPVVVAAVPKKTITLNFNAPSREDVVDWAVAAGAFEANQGGPRKAVDIPVEDPEVICHDELLAAIDLLVLDCDGVLTDNTVTVNHKGHHSLTFHRGDGMGIRLLKEAGVLVIVVSGSSDPAISHRLEAISVPGVFGCHDKPDAIREHPRRMGLAAGTAETYAYVGNDLNDIPAMEAAAVSIAVADAHPSVIAIADFVTKARGGHGAVREVCDMILKARE